MKDVTRSIHGRIHDSYRDDTPSRLGFVRRAFALLPAMDPPHILDVGCGRGSPTLELARLSDGEVVGVDIDRSALDELKARADAAGLAERIRIRCGSFLGMGFHRAEFDIVWAEASLHVMTLEVGLDACARVLKPSGYLVAHEMVWLRPNVPGELAGYWKGRFPGICTIPEFEALASRRGLSTLDSFPLPEDFWLEEYFRVIARRIRELRSEFREDRRAMDVLDREQRIVDLHARNPGWYGSAYFIMRREAGESD